MDQNVVEAYLEREGLTTDDYWMQCDWLAIKAKVWAENEKGIVGEVIFISPENALCFSPAIPVPFEDGETVPCWGYHAVLVMGGVVHDPWFGEPTPLLNYLKAMFHHESIKLTRGHHQSHHLIGQGQPGVDLQVSL